MTTDDLKFFAGLGAIALVVISLLVYLGLKVNKAVGEHASEINFSLNVALTGTALYACMVASWIYAAAVRILRPDSRFGAFLNTPDGVATIVIGSIILFVIAAAVLKRIGYPIFDDGEGP